VHRMHRHHTRMYRLSRLIIKMAFVMAIDRTVVPIPRSATIARMMDRRRRVRRRKRKKKRHRVVVIASRNEGHRIAVAAVGIVVVVHTKDAQARKSPWPWSPRAPRVDPPRLPHAARAAHRLPLPLRLHRHPRR